ncbi:hypothetical protein [Shewanella nanhaiensis]|uniref:Uncharacterized protein n=1 Tax=Shewanella nanhaiensis TaxID=2864872 RepID=A0ABS7DZJ6_9GAMM|nr:hypothetical protein [Shewanella nanhaiensis]MBW8182779.1 hypothetical protein [Shewanella nanhaiensis]
MKTAQMSLLTLVIFLALGVTLYLIGPTNQKEQPESWSSFVYTQGYESGRYKKLDDFNDYTSCRAYSIETSAKFEQAPWECGLRCRFDSSRQGFQCEAMENK